MNYPDNIAIQALFNSLLRSLFILLLFNSCSQNKEKPLSIAVAANAKHALEEVCLEFEKEHGVKTNIISASSGKLSAQIKAGAPYDLFISADLKYPKDLYEKGLTHSKPEVYALGQLIMISSIKITGKDLHFLSNENVKHISISNPKTAPYGFAALESINYFNLRDNIDKKLVYGESVGQCNQFFISGAADLALTSQSILFAYEFEKEIYHQFIDPKSYSPIKQGIVQIKNGNENHKSANLFYLFLFGEKAKKILEEHAYKIPI